MSFMQSYRVETAELPAGGQRSQQLYYYPPGTSEGGVGHGGGMIIHVTPNEAQDWFGVFAPGSEDDNMLHMVSTTPDPDAVCVVSRGAGYIVRTRTPHEWEEINVFPIRDFIAIADPPTIVFVDETRLAAYGPGGRKWRTVVSLEGFHDLEARESAIHGRAFRDNLIVMTSFEVDARSGELVWNS